MTLSTHLLASWDPEVVGRSGRTLACRAQELRTFSRALARQGADLGGVGAVTAAHLERAAALHQQTSQAAEGLEVVAEGLRLASEALVQAQALLRRAEQVAAGAGLTVLADGAVLVLQCFAEDDLLAAAASAQAQAGEALEAAAEADREAAALLRSIPTLLPGADRPWWQEMLARVGLSVLLADLGSRQLPAAGAGPDQVAAWWASLAPADRLALERRSPAQLGSLSGLPLAVRDRANRAVLARALAVPPPGGSFDAMMNWARNAQLAASVRAALADHEPARLLLLDPNSPGRAAIALGDLATARHVAVLVPGMNASVTSAMGGTVRDAARLRERALSKDAGTVATVAWIGYHAPGMFSVLSDARAQQGAARLGNTLLGLQARASATGRPLHLTLSGHSYGSLVAGYAVRERTGVDDLVVLGSPGVSVGRAEELWVPAERVFVAEAHWDPIADLGRFGADPSSGEFGAREMQTDGRSDPQQERLRGISGHSNYYEQGTESLDNLALVTIGRPEEVSYD